LLNPGQILSLDISLAFGFVLIMLEIIQCDFSKAYTLIHGFWHGNRKRNKIFRWMMYFAIITIILFSVGEGKADFVYFRF
jgi:hypothetical protein